MNISSNCAKNPTTEQKLHDFEPGVFVKGSKMKTCQTCQRPMISDGEICGACNPPKVALNGIEGPQKGKHGHHETQLEAFDFPNEAPLNKAIVLGAFTSGWAAGLMMAQMEYADRMVYRKPSVHLLETSNARTRRHCHCGKCSNGRCGLCESKHA